jgi:hypothetical protein
MSRAKSYMARLFRNTNDGNDHSVSSIGTRARFSTLELVTEEVEVVRPWNSLEFVENSGPMQNLPRIFRLLNGGKNP